MNRNSYSIGYRDEDNNFVIIATLNNKAGVFGYNERCLVEAITNIIAIAADYRHIECLRREDAPDCVVLES